jgi:hypothetical protein
MEWELAVNQWPRQVGFDSHLAHSACVAQWSGQRPFKPIVGSSSLSAGTTTIDFFEKAYSGALYLRQAEFWGFESLRRHNDN